MPRAIATPPSCQSARLLATPPTSSQHTSSQCTTTLPYPPSLSLRSSMQIWSGLVIPPVRVVHHDVKHVFDAQAAHSLVHVVAQPGAPLTQGGGACVLPGPQGKRKGGVVGLRQVCRSRRAMGSTLCEGREQALRL